MYEAEGGGLGNVPWGLWKERQDSDGGLKDEINGIWVGTEGSLLNPWPGEDEKLKQDPVPDKQWHH